METEFPFAEIPPELWPVVGKPDEGSRIYRREGSEEEAGVWFDALVDIIGNSVSPGGVGMYCPVSRAAVHKRIKEGRLSAFMFHVTHRSTTVFGKSRVLRASPYCCIPVSECKAWKAELEEAVKRRGQVSAQDLEGREPDWTGEFMQWKEKSERYREGLLSSFGGLTLRHKVGLVKSLLTGSDYTVVHKPRKGKE